MPPVIAKNKPEEGDNTQAPLGPALSRDAEEMLAAHLVKTHVVLPQQIQDARDSQRLASEFNMQLSLGEALVKLGSITHAQRNNIEAHIREEYERSKKISHFKLGGVLGVGAMGTVYRAEDTVARREVALKVLSEEYAKYPQFLKRFQNEARALGKLNHPNIVAAFDVGEDRGRYFVVMELCEGKSLEERLKNKKPIPYEEALDIVLQAAHGLEHAHQRGLIHRDIKPGNILVADGIAKILDLGLSKSTETTDAFSTAQGMTVGTPHYMSPEQARGSASIDARTDIYSLGVTLFHMVTGSPPFVAKTAERIMEKHLKEKAPKASEFYPGVPSCVDVLIQRMMAKKPDERYPDCGTLIADIRRVMQGKVPLEVSAPSRKGDSNVALKSQSSTIQDAVHPRGSTHHHGSQARIDRPDRTRTGKAAQIWSRPYLLYGSYGVVAALLLVLVYLNFSRDVSPTRTGTTAMAVKNGAENEVKTGTPNPVESLPEVRAAPTPEPKASKAPKPPPQAIDVMKSVNVSRNGVNGKWWQDDSGLVCDPGPAAKIEIPYSPPAEYDFQISFTRESGDDTVMLVLPYADQAFCVKMGDQRNVIYGVETLNGFSALDSRNPTRKHQAEGWITNGQRNTAYVEVRRTSIKTYLNGRPMAEFDPTKVKLDTGPTWRFRDTRILGVGSWMSKTRFHEIKVTEISGPGRFFR